MNRKYRLTKYEDLTDKNYGKLDEKRKITEKEINNKCDLCDSPATVILENWRHHKIYGCDGHTNYLISKKNAVKFSPYNVVFEE